MTDDATGFFGNAVGTGNACPVVTVFGPDGSIVKESFWIKDNNQLWANVAAFRGGFCIRQRAKIYFFDDTGTPYKTNTVSGALDTTRGDYARLASDIRSPYVYLASPNSTGLASTNINLAIWDARTGNSVLITNISDDVPHLASLASGSDAIRCGVAVDALDRVCVAYSASPDTTYFLNNQVMARVMKFDGTNVSFLTPTFFPFVNSDTNSASLLGYLTKYPHVSMTTKAICIAAKGYVNSTNNPAGGPDTKTDTTVYTVITHPEPQGTPLPTISISKSASNVVISYPAICGLWTLQSTPSLSPAAWADVTPQPAPVLVGTNYTLTVPIASTDVYFRIRLPNMWPVTYTYKVPCGSSNMGVFYNNNAVFPQKIKVGAISGCVGSTGELVYYDKDHNIVQTTPLPATVDYTLKEREQVQINCPGSGAAGCSFTLTVY